MQHGLHRTCCIQSKVSQRQSKGVQGVFYQQTRFLDAERESGAPWKAPVTSPLNWERTWTFTRGLQHSLRSNHIKHRSAKNWNHDLRQTKWFSSCNSSAALFWRHLSARFFFEELAGQQTFMLCKKWAPKMHTKNIPVSCKLQQLLQSLRFWRINWLGCTSWHNSRQLRIRVIKVYTSYHNNYINNICVYEKTKTHNNTVCHSLSNSHFYKPFASGLPSYLCQTCSSEARAQHAFTVPCRMHKARFGLHTLSVDMSTGELQPL